MRPNKRFGQCLAILAVSSAVHSAQLTYLSQFRVHDAFARVNTPLGQANQSNIAEAPNFGPFLSQFTLNASKGTGTATVSPYQASSLSFRGFRAEMWTSGSASVAPTSSDTGLTFAHNVFSIVFRTDVGTTLLIEAVQVQEQVPGLQTTNAIDIQKNLAPFAYFPNNTGTVGAVLSLEAGANYKLGTGVDLSGVATASEPSVSGYGELRLNAELGTTVPNVFIELAGSFQGGAEEASYDDGQLVRNFCDELSPIGEFQVEGIAATASPTDLKVKFESASSLLGNLEVVRVFDHVNGSYQFVGARPSTATPSLCTLSLSNPGRFVGPDRAIKTRLAWLPISDVAATDGWINTLDFIRWTAH